MRLIFLIPLVIAVLAAVLYFSTRYDYEVNGDKIAVFQCEKAKTIPALEDIFENYKIEEEGKSKPYLEKDKSYLGLNYTNIEELPDSIFFGFSCLKNVNLSKNKLKTIPSSLRHLPELEELHLNFNQLSSLNTTVLSELYHLKKLDFSDNPVPKLTIPIIANPIDYFGCARCGLNSIDTIHSVMIDELNLHRNNFTSIPAELFNLNNLRYLNLSRNKIEKIDLEKNFPPQFYYPNLISLDLSSNRLTEFPTSLYKFPNLIHLQLENNYLSGTLTLKGLLYLEALNIPNQNLTKVVISNTVPDKYGTETTISDFSPSMDSIHLKNNKIEYFIVEAEQNNSIHIINLSQNKLSDFPRDLYKFKKLESLDLSYNLIESVTINGKFGEDLSILDLSHNQIQEIAAKPLTPMSSNSFGKVDLSYNRLTLIPSGFLFETKTTELNLSNNNIKNMMFTEPSNSRFDELQILDLSNNPITSWDASISHLSFLRELNLSNTNIKNIPFDDLANMYQLDVIVLKNTEIPEKQHQEMKTYLKQYDIEVIF